MIRFIVQVLINALALAVSVWVLAGVELTAGQGLLDFAGGDETLATVLAYLLIGLIFGLVNALIRPIISFLSIPITCLTLGLFTLVINALMILLTAWLSQYTAATLSIDNFWWGVGAGLIVSIVSAVLGWIAPKKTV